MNRLLELEKEILRYKEKKAVAKSWPGSRQASQMRSYTVPGLVPALRQPKSMDCWITAITMLYSWKNQQSLSIEQVATEIGEPFLSFFRDNSGLYPRDEQELLSRTGLVGEFGYNLSIDGYFDFLRRFGPLYISAANTDANTPSWGMHARIMIGIRSDGTAGNTTVRLIDPGNGREYEEPFSRYLQLYEREVAETGQTRNHIIHWPAGAQSQQKSFFPKAFTQEVIEDMDVDELEDTGLQEPGVSMTAAFCPVNYAEDAASKNFTLREFACKDGAAVPKSHRGNIQLLMNQLEVLRSDLKNAAVRIVSGYRTKTYNQGIKGAKHSRHLCGQAADIQVEGYTPREVHAAIESLIKAGKMQQGGLGLYQTFVHYDTYYNGIRPRRWKGKGVA